MGVFLNSSAPYENYKEIASDTYFVDKSPLIEELLPALGKRDRHFCITRPRRFGKSVMADMIGARFRMMSRGITGPAQGRMMKYFIISATTLNLCGMTWSL